MQKIKLEFFLLLFLGIALFAGGAQVTNLTAIPRYPWDGKVDITFDIEYDDTEVTWVIGFYAYAKDMDRKLEMTSLSGDGVGESLKAGGPYKVVWDSAKDYPEGYSSALTVVIDILRADNGYLVVDLTAGSFRYSTAAPDLTDDTCRTTELWLRFIPAGTFTMGSPEDEVGRGYDETQHQVTLTEPFYIGVFEMTQKQYELIYGSNPSNYTGDTRPVELVSYDEIRGSSTGAGWPSSHDVDSDSFLGKLRSKTGLTFDLPTEAQWEYACRAGTTTALNTGKNLTSTSQDSAMDEAGRYAYNKSDGKGGYSRHTKVGSYLPNNWGLYDMHGNMWEWCLDWYQSDLGSTAVTDPVGATEGSGRVPRGGSWIYDAQYCRSAHRSSYNPSDDRNSLGFRVVLLP